MSGLMSSSAAAPLLEVRGLSVTFPVRTGFFQRVTRHFRAVEDVSLTLARNEVLGLVGESGCGKTTLGQAILRLIKATRGEVLFHAPSGPVDLLKLDRRRLRDVRRHMQLVFQNPASAMNPRFTASQVIEEPLRLNEHLSAAQTRERVASLLSDVGLGPDVALRPPAAFSGGQRQRLVIARALALAPMLLVADEPVSALDVSVQAQILNLLAELKLKYQLSYLFISHNLQVVRFISDRIAVMYKGRIVELGPAGDVYASPRHPYTELLLAAIPEPDPELQRRRPSIRFVGEPPPPDAEVAGCPFHPRCAHARPQCRERRPELVDAAPGHATACHLSGELSLKGGGQYATLA